MPGTSTGPKSRPTSSTSPAQAAAQAVSPAGRVAIGADERAACVVFAEVPRCRIRAPQGAIDVSIVTGVWLALQIGAERNRRGDELPSDLLSLRIGGDVDQLDGVDVKGCVAGAGSAYAPVDLVEVLQGDLGRGPFRTGPVPRRPAREGDLPCPTSPNRPAGPGPYAPSAPGWPRPPPCTAGGEPGPTGTLPPNSRPCSTRSPLDTALISTAEFNELPVHAIPLRTTS